MKKLTLEQHQLLEDLTGEEYTQQGQKRKHPRTAKQSYDLGLLTLKQVVERMESIEEEESIFGSISMHPDRDLYNCLQDIFLTELGSRKSIVGKSLKEVREIIWNFKQEIKGLI